MALEKDKLKLCKRKVGNLPLFVQTYSITPPFSNTCLKWTWHTVVQMKTLNKNIALRKIQKILIINKIIYKSIDHLNDNFKPPLWKQTYRQIFVIYHFVRPGLTCIFVIYYLLG